MRIGMFVDMYKPYLSGVTNHVSLHKRQFEEAGHEVYVFAFGNRRYADDEPHVVRSAGVGIAGTGAQIGLAFSAKARGIIHTLDVAHVHHPFVSGRLVLQAVRPLNIPVIFTNHSRYDLYSDAYAGFLPRSLRYGYLSRYLDRFCGSCDLVIVPSPGIEQWLEDLGIGGRLAMLPNAVDTRPFREPTAPLTKSALGFPDDAVLVAYVGRLSSEKNVGVLADAFIRAAGTEPSLHMLLIGDGNSTEDTRTALTAAGLADRVRFTGALPYERIPDHCAAADLFATASVSEVHPLVVIEAMAAGLPVLGVHSPGISDTVEDGETGLLVPSDGDVAEALAERMRLIAQDGGLRARLGERAAVVAETRYDIRQSNALLLEHYERLIEEKRRRRG